MRKFRHIQFGMLFFIILATPCMAFAAPPSMSVSDLSSTKSGDDIHLAWTAITADAYGNTATIDHYNVYRDTSPNFIPDTTNGANRIGQPAGNFYDDVDALLSADSYYYYVTAVTADGTESLLPSNIGYKIRLALSYDPIKSNKYWTSIPYNTSYTTANDIGGDAPNISQVIRWDPATQTEEVWYQESSTGINFTITPGETYAIVISNDTVVNIVGSHTPTTIDMTYNTDNFNVNWFSLPFPNAYGTASTLSQDITNSTKVGKYDTLNETYESWFLLDSIWMGDDFNLIPEEGYLCVITDDTTWSPSIGYPTVTASADTTDGLFSVAVNLSGTAEDKNGTIDNYEWDYEGDGTFDYSDTSSPDTSHTYNTAGTYYPTLLVTDNDGFQGYDYQTVDVYSIENEMSVEDFNPFDVETAQFTYTISDNGLMTIKIYDKNDSLVRTLITDQAVTAGENSTAWDGKNDSDEIVPDGAYYVVFEYSIGGKPYTYTFDLRTSTGGEDITGDITGISVSDILSPLEGQYVNIAYTLPQKSLVTIEIKDQSGTVIRHLLTDVPRTAGAHTEIWDGADDSGQVVQPGTTFSVTITATSLADNAIITKGFAPTLTKVSASPLRFSPATNPYGTQDKSSVLVTFALNKQADVTATVYTASGAVVRTITHTGLSAGQNQISWNGRNNSSILMSDGKHTIYLRAQDSDGTYSDIFYVQVEIFY